MPNAISCDPAAVAKASACFCGPEESQRAQMLYLLLQISGLNLTPAQLAEKSKCFCFEEKAGKAAELYLLCQIASAAGA